jgi:hypothetical protein
MFLFDDTIFKIKFNYKLSYFLIPLIYVLYNYVPNIRTYILYHIVCVGIVGTIESVYGYLENNIGIGTLFISSIIHLSLLSVLIHFKKYGKINMISLVLLFMANLIIFFLPYWPYSIKRESIFVLYNFIYSFLCFVYFYTSKQE